MRYGKIDPQGPVIDNWQLLHESDFEDTDTKLLLHLDNDVVDYATGKTVTNAAAFSTTVWKFGSQSISFNGSSQYLTVPDSVDWAFGTGNFTIDFWVKFNSLSGNQGIVSQRDGANDFWFIYKDDSVNTWEFCFQVGGVNMGYYTSPGSWADLSWHHFAFIRNGANALIFVDGVSQTLTTYTAFGGNDTGNFTGKLKIGTIGTDGSEGYFLNGWIDELRIVKGTAKWTANFTPPTAPYLGRTTTYPITNDRNTVLMISGEGVDGATTIIDETGKTVTVGGGAQIDTAQYKFGQSSVLFDGVGDYLSLADSTDWYFGTNDLTIDFWVRFNALPADLNTQFLFSQRTDDTHKWDISLFNYTTGGSGIRWEWGANPVIGVYKYTTISANVWYHMAFVRSGNNFMIFQNGVQVGATEVDTDAFPDVAANLNIGVYGDGSTGPFNGWLDDIRISKGIARWTSNFTPPLRTTATINGDTDEEYRLVLSGYTTNNSNIYLRFNNDTAANYGYQDLRGTNASIAAYRSGATSNFLLSFANTAVCEADAIIYAKSGYVRTGVINSTEDISGTTVGQMAGMGFTWNNATDPMAAIYFNSSSAGGLGLGTKALLYRKVNA